jgi:hypothetical protein
MFLHYGANNRLGTVIPRQIIAFYDIGASGYGPLIQRPV